MSMTVEEFKQKVIDDFKADPLKFVRPDSGMRILSKAISSGGAVEPDFKFASDEAISDYLNGNMKSMSLCCLACVKVLGESNCISPHWGPCEPMC